MLVAPLVLGALLSGRFDWRQLLLGVFWITGYLAFFATGLWLKSRRKTRYLPPVKAYVPAATVLGLAMGATAPHLLVWIPLFVVPLGVGLYASATRDERSIWSGLATTAGATLMTPVAFDVAGSWEGETGRVWFATLALALYLAGTVFYVKTMIRERGSKGWWLASVAWHVVALAVVTAGPTLWLVQPGGPGLDPALAGVFGALLARAAALPSRRLSPAAVGVLEIAMTVAVVVTLWR